MKNLITILLTFLLINLFSCSESSEASVQQDTQITKTKAALIESNNVFAFKIFKSIVEDDTPGTNLFISPLSLYYALSMAANGANGSTYEAFKQTLAYELPKENTLIEIKELYEQLIKDEDKMIVEIANSLWTDKSFKIKDKYYSELVEYFHAYGNNLDFTSSATVKTINNWIADKTHDKIQNMLSSISPDEVLFLINAIYFKGDWLTNFDERLNTTRSFYLENDNQVEVEYMSRKTNFPYYTNQVYSAIQLPYADTNYYMTVFLPNLAKTSEDIVDELTNEEWNKIQDMFVQQEISITIPKFKFGYGVRNMNKELQDMGLKEAFSDEADFSGISDLGLAISRVLHKSYIDVNEKGSEAAAATIVGIELTSMNPEQITFVADHPFIFTISERTTNTILFMGKVSEPDYE